MKYARWCGIAILATGLAATVDGQTLSESWKPVTSDRVLHPDDGSWLSYRRTYDATAFSPLHQIDSTNVNQLRAVWTYAVPDNSRWAPEPLIANGVMYLVQGGGRVTALDAVSGDTLWVHDRRYPTDIVASQAFGRARGLAIYDDVIYWGTADTHLLALEARTGKLIWETSTGDYHDADGHNHAPLVADGKVFIGHAGGDLGVPGRMRAFDAKTGKLLWTTRTAPTRDDPKAYASWEKHDTIRPAGAAPWNSITYDPELKLVYFGTGQPTPWTSAIRGKGDALYSDSALALDANTGKIRWYFQMAPGDNWDRAVFEPMLVDLPFKGKVRKTAILTSKVGWGVVVDRATGEYLSSFKTAYDNMILGWTDKGKAIVNPATVPSPEDVGSGKVFEVCPHFHGARNLQAGSFSKKTGYYYLGVNNSCMDARVVPIDLRNMEPGMMGRPGRDKRALTGVIGTPKLVPGMDYVGEFVAFDPVTGKRAWAYRVPGGAAMTAPALATEGDIVFGGSVDRRFFALNAKDGTLLWQTRLSGDVSGSPITFEVGGRQFVAVAAGGKPSVSTSFGPLTNVDLSNGSGTITVFALPDPRDSASRPPAAKVIKHSSDGTRNAIVPAADAPQAATTTTPMKSVGGPALYTAAQAAAGARLFATSCASCHSREDHSGANFRAKWAGGPISPLYDLVSTTMPLDAPGSLAKGDYAAILAFMMSESGYPAGNTPLPSGADTLANVKLMK